MSLDEGDETLKFTQKGLAHVMPIVAGMSKATFGGGFQQAESCGNFGRRPTGCHAQVK